MTTSLFRLLALLFLALSITTGCATVSHDIPKPSSEVITDTSKTEFGSLAEGWLELHGAQSGIFPFVYGADALGARLSMADRAEKSIDLQYFLMKDDAAGNIVSNALWRAADRGVRVRFLLDDVFTSAPDSGLMALNSHPNIEVRLFNPISRRGFHKLNFLGQFRRANRRMHNKAFIVDNAIGIVGGRNIADEYFQLKTDSVFSDFDVLAFGAVVPQVSASFDKYWNHALAIPIEQFVDSTGDELSSLESFEPEEVDRRKTIYAEAIDKDLVSRLTTGEQDLFVANARVIADRPDKLQNAVGKESMDLATELGRILSDAKSELLFITPYYVPRNDGVDFVRSIVDKGVRVVIVTNSLASTNHIPVHSAYSSYRRKVLQAGVELFEVRANAGREAQGEQGPEQLTLHTKLIVIDRRYVFVGSLNLDPRSIEINAEMGMLIDSPELAEQVAEGLAQNLPDVAYRVIKNEYGVLEWHANIEGQSLVERTEPLSSRWRRFKAWVLRIAPEGQL